MSAGKVHLVCGPTGAGKTTLSIALAERLGAVRFSIDEWMTTLFWADSPQPLEFAWSIERVRRCEAQIWSTALRIAGRGIPAILDLGFSTVRQRGEFIARARDAGLSVVIHVADAPADERWRRVQTRNVEKGATYQLKVTREMFDFMEGIWESLTPEEKAIASN